MLHNIVPCRALLLHVSKTGVAVNLVNDITYSVVH